MKVPGSIYIDKKGKTYVALYNFWSDVYRAAPPSIKQESEKVGHVAYGFEGRTSGIDLFHCLKLPSALFNEIDVKRTIKESQLSPSYKETLKNIDQQYNIRTEIKYDHLPILDLGRVDIRDFTRKPAKHPGQNHIIVVDEIKPRTKIRTIKHKYLLQGGKSVYVPSCILEANLDFSWGCPSAFLGGTLDGDFITGGFLDVFAECGYCYSSYQHKTFWKTIFDFTKEQLEDELFGNCYLEYGRQKKHGKSIKILRLGKRTEAGSKFTRESLVKTLETCIETGTRVVMPTKYLEYDKEIAKLLKKTNSVVLYSIGWDKFELGACSHGCTNEFRLEQAKHYRGAGVNSIIYLLVDLPRAPTKREHDILNFAEKNDIYVQLLPIRIPGKELALEITGMTWDELKKRSDDKQIAIPGILEDKIGGYSNDRYTLIAQEKHPFWLELVGNNKDGKIRMCHHDEQETYCGTCFTCKGFIKNTEHVEVKYDRFRKGNYRKGKIEASTPFFTNV